MTPLGCPLGRVENSKTFQNQMSQCFFIGLYDIETGDDFYFFQIFFLIGYSLKEKKRYYLGIFPKNFFLIGGNGFKKKSIFTREK